MAISRLSNVGFGAKITPTDARMAVRLCVEKDKYNSLYIPLITANKPTDGNIPEI